MRRVPATDAETNEEGDRSHGDRGSHPNGAPPPRRQGKLASAKSRSIYSSLRITGGTYVGGRRNALQLRPMRGGAAAVGCTVPAETAAAHGATTAVSAYTDNDES